MTTKLTPHDAQANSASEQTANLNDHGGAAEAHEVAAEAHERAAEHLCVELAELAHAATYTALRVGGPAPPSGPLPDWYIAGFRAGSWSNVAFGVRAGASPSSQLRGHQEAAATHRDAAREHRLLTVEPRLDEN